MKIKICKKVSYFLIIFFLNIYKTTRMSSDFHKKETANIYAPGIKRECRIQVALSPPEDPIDLFPHDRRQVPPVTCQYVYIYICTRVYMYIYIYIYTHTQVLIFFF